MVKGKGRTQCLAQRAAPDRVLQALPKTTGCNWTRHQAPHFVAHSSANHTDQRGVLVLRHPRQLGIQQRWRNAGTQQQWRFGHALLLRTAQNALDLLDRNRMVGDRERIGAEGWLLQPTDVSKGNSRCSLESASRLINCMNPLSIIVG